MCSCARISSPPPLLKNLMEQRPATTTSTPSTEQQPPPQPPQTPPSPPSTSSSLPPPSSVLPSTSSPNPNPRPSTSQPNPQPHQQQARPPFNRPWQQPSSFPHFSSSSPSLPPVPPFSSSTSSAISAAPPQRGGMAIGVPAHHPNPPPPPPASFSSLTPPSFGQQYSGLGRNVANLPDSVASSSTSQARQPIQGMGMMGSLGSSSSMRPGVVPAHHQLRPGQSVLRPQTNPNNPTPASQNFQGHSMLRGSTVGSPSSPSPNTSQSSQLHTQPWLSSGPQGKPPLPPSSPRAQMNPQSLQQRSHIPQQHRSITASLQQQSSSVQQPPPSHQPQEHYEQQFPSSRIQQSLPHQQQITRGQGLGGQKPSFHATVQPSTSQLGPPNRTSIAESSETCNRILSKRSIQELVTQVSVSVFYFYFSTSFVQTARLFDIFHTHYPPDYDDINGM
ncbi:unnamed protein product [Ilex paraguariensis]|uniref:Uncharacterized protein n=1 Tax=Ilex paraguariensis TaxID=185542 RepID=A0ABC8QQK5_9AQUA